MIYSGYTGKLTCIALALTALGAAGTGRAQETRTQVVALADLDLTRSVDIERLDDRLRRAVVGVCGGYEASSAREIRMRNQCREDAWNGIEPQRTFAIARDQRNEGAGELAARSGRGGIRIAIAN